MTFAARRVFPALFGCLLAAHWPAQAQLIIDDALTGTSSSFNWLSLNGACLTAGNNTGTIPACKGLAYYTGKNSVLMGGATGTLPDAVGLGALRLTNGDKIFGATNGDYQTGAVVSNFTFPSNEGLQVAFTTVTYGGDGLSGTGADGMAFFLADGSKPASVGASGGSLGYSCTNGANTPYEGVRGGYLGIGIDEFGNFSKPADNTNTGPGYKAGRLTLRGSGDTSYAFLSTDSATKKYYPTTLSDPNKKLAVTDTCRTGYLWNYSGGKLNGIDDKSQTNTKLAYNYNYISSSDLPSTVSIANQEAVDLSKSGAVAIPAPVRDSARPITYSIKITQDGLLNFSYSFNGGAEVPVVKDRLITDSNGPLPASFRFGFSAGSGSGSNIHEITCFKAAPFNQSNSSGSTNVPPSARVEAGTQLYLAYYHPKNWWGELTAQNLLYDAVSDSVSINAVANWNASCVLTGGTCQATSSSNVAQTSAQRVMLTSNGAGVGKPFQWTDLSTAQRTSLMDTSGEGDLRLRYLRGDRSDEVTAAGAGSLRARTGVLGDIIDSSPTWVGAPALPYTGTWKDAINASSTAPESSGQAYSAYQTARKTRLNVVYAGANDGFLHGFRSGYYGTDGLFASDTSKPNDGKEVLAYMPAALLSLIHSKTTLGVDFSAVQYAHSLYANATPGTGDLYYSGAWHTWLVSGIGAGGNVDGPISGATATANGVLFALDVSDPSAFTEANAATLVKGEWTSSSLTCTNTTSCGTSLGSTYGTPIIRRLHNGKWAVLFGNGLNSASGTAGLYIMLIEPTDGSISFRFIDTGYGPSKDPAGKSAKNGIAYVTSADLDSDHITDYVYAGDVFGNVWRFDLTSASPASWAVGTAPMFSTPAGQPITTRVTVSSVVGIGLYGQSGVMVSFGTGQQFPQTLVNATQYATGAQALYGLWDWNMTGWNAKTTPASAYAALSAPQTVSTAALQAQSVTGTKAGKGVISDYRTVSAIKVCWKGSVSCSSDPAANTRLGWTLPLPTGTEQVIFNPTVAYGIFLVNTSIPSVTQPLTCETRPAAGYTMAVALESGGATKTSVFADAGGTFTTTSGSLLSGIGLSATGTPSIVMARNRPYLVQQTTAGKPVISRINPVANAKGSRVTWVKLR
jgi:type IV pilus assembly protein PilY1